MIVCDLCGEAKDCAQRQIESKQYDICSDCWAPIAEKLKGKGRVKREREAVFLPSLTEQPKPQESVPPEVPPIIWARQNQTQ